MAAQMGIARSVIRFKKTRKIKDLERNIEVKKRGGTQALLALSPSALRSYSF
jgi:hypothetical protein